MNRVDRMQQRLAAGEILIIDGGMGTEIEARDVEMDDGAWCALANGDHADVVEAIHRDFLAAGADVIITNTFPTGRPTLEAAGHGHRYEELNRQAVNAALRARDAAGTQAVIAGAIGGLPTAADMTFHPRGLTADELYDAFRDQATLLAESGVDLIALEMLGPGGYADPAVRGALAAGLPVWIGASVLRLLDDDETDYGSLSVPADRRAFDEIVALADDRIAAVTVMHSHVDEVVAALDAIREVWTGPMGAYPHYGRFEAPHWHFHDISPAEYLARARTWVEHGAQLIGGCCGIRPEHIAALRDGLATTTV